MHGEQDFIFFIVENALLPQWKRNHGIWKYFKLYFNIAGLIWTRNAFVKNCDYQQNDVQMLISFLCHVLGILGNRFDEISSLIPY